MTEEQFPRQPRTRATSGPDSSPQWSRLHTFEFNLHSWWRAGLLFLVVGFVAVLLGAEALRAAYVAMLADKVDPAALRKAVALDPSNPELHHRLGMVLSDSLSEGERAEGFQHLRRATELEPYGARYWSDLAWVCEVAGDTACATHGTEQAVKLSPMTPQLRWVAANTLLRAGQTDAAIAEFRRLLELDPSYGPATFHLCLGALGDPQIILQKVMPAGNDPRLKLAYLSLLNTNELADQAHEVWAGIVVAGVAFPLPLATPYLDQLLHQERMDQAQSMWRDLEKLGIVPSPAAGDEDNRVYNGDFEQTPLDAGFDWRSPSNSYIALDFADPSAHSGKRCLRVDFTVSRNEGYEPLFQLVPVEAKHAYLLTAYVRSQDITSDSGPRLRVQDPTYPASTSAVSETTVGTTPWHPISLKFCTGPETKLLQLSVIRVRGRTYPTEITGSFWLDTVALKPLDSGVEGGCPASDR